MYLIFGTQEELTSFARDKILTDHGVFDDADACDDGEDYEHDYTPCAERDDYDPGIDEDDFLSEEEADLCDLLCDSINRCIKLRDEIDGCIEMLWKASPRRGNEVINTDLVSDTMGKCVGIQAEITII